MVARLTKGLNASLLSGHVIECFDNTLYGFFAVMLVPLYFPSTSEHAGYLASYGAFAAGFIARPLGALFFGWLGDRSGRRSPLMWTMICVGVPTMLIGLLPTYDSIGLWAPALMIVFRLTQGFFWGGEFTGVNLHISENFSEHVLGRKTGLLIGFGVAGAVAATMAGAVFTMDWMPSWCWRIPFVVGGTAAIGVYFFRRHLQETADFMKAREENRLTTSPWQLLLSDYKRQLVLSCMISGLTIMPLYAATILGNRLFKELGYSTSESLMLNMVSMVINGLLIMFVVGRVADFVGFRRQIIGGSLTIALVVFPCYWLISGAVVNTAQIYGFMIILVSAGTIINGCAMPYIASFFPTNCRYTAVAMSVTLGHALLGGTMPLMGTFLTHTFNSSYAPAYWICCIAVLITLGAYYLPLQWVRDNLSMGEFQRGNL